MLVMNLCFTLMYHIFVGMSAVASFNHSFRVAIIVLVLNETCSGVASFQAAHDTTE